MADTLPFLVQITADGRYLNVRIPVSSLPAELRKRPSAMNVRLMPETAKAKQQSLQTWVPDYLLALVTPHVGSASANPAAGRRREPVGVGDPVHRKVWERIWI